MRFLTVVMLSMSFLAAAEPKPKEAVQPVKKVKVSRGKSFFRAVGSFGVGMLTDDPYTATIPKKTRR